MSSFGPTFYRERGDHRMYTLSGMIRGSEVDREAKSGDPAWSARLKAGGRTTPGDLGSRI